MEAVTLGSRKTSKVVVNTRVTKTKRGVRIKIWFDTTAERKSDADNRADCINMLLPRHAAV